MGAAGGAPHNWLISFSSAAATISIIPKKDIYSKHWVLIYEWTDYLYIGIINLLFKKAIY